MLVLAGNGHKLHLQNKYVSPSIKVSEEEYNYFKILGTVELYVKLTQILDMFP